MTTYSESALRAGREIAGIIVPHSNFVRVLDYVRNAIQIGAQTGVFAGVRISASSGSGKTLLMEHLADVLGQEHGSHGNVPLIAGSLKEDPSVSHIQGELLSKFKYAMTSPDLPATSKARANNSDVNQVLVNCIKSRGVRIIVLDEFQHVYLASGTKVATHMIDWLKRLINATRVPVALLGTEMMDRLDTIDPQLTSRIPTHIKLPPFRLGPEWLGFLRGFSESCKVVDLSPIYRTFPSAMFAATSGSPRLLKGLLVQAVMLAVDEKEQVMTPTRMSLAYEYQTGVHTAEENPFASL
ncbi:MULTISPECIES: TniB family NTP-binding protein [Achromobacter]|uniref:AAA+ ATPase domain-containing protein n=1 Tax=Achromobacter spanius TaxID=217203 RepID=A0AAW3I8X4_9BURK|nr:TniB family NTP-binding protein [Achromobacter spanius]KNE29079.1 hypothetical protein AFM18_04400 [Achromobacter spanius]MCD0501247.1 TniB family NTP-binding protein [Achromobacter sp. MY14]